MTRREGAVVALLAAAIALSVYFNFLASAKYAGVFARLLGR